MENKHVTILGEVMGFRPAIRRWMSLDLAVHFLSGNPLKPILREEPDSVVSKQTKVTLLHERTSGVKEYHIYRKRSPYPWCKQIPFKPREKG